MFSMVRWLEELQALLWIRWMSIWGSRRLETEPPQTYRDAMIGRLCDGNTSQREHELAMQHLMHSPANVTEEEVRHFLVFLEQHLHPEHSCLLIQVLSAAVRAHPEFFEVMSTEASVSVYHNLANNPNLDVQTRLSQLLLEFKLHQRPCFQNTPMQEFLVRTAENAVLDGAHLQRSPLTGIIFKIIHWRLERFVWDWQPVVPRMSNVFLHKLMEEPFNVQILTSLFLILEMWVEEIGTRNHSVFSLIHSIVPGDNRILEPGRMIIDLLCAGIQSCVARDQNHYLEGVAHEVVPRLQTLPYVLQDQQTGISFETGFKLVREIMNMLVKAAANLDHLRECPSCEDTLWSLTDNTHWSLKEQLRVILMESGDPQTHVPKRFLLPTLNPQQLQKVMRLHGVSRATAMQCNLTGEQLCALFNNAGHPLDFLYSSNHKEKEILRRMVNVFKAMKRITGRPDCDCITNAEMEGVLGFLNNLPHVQVDQLRPQIRAVQDEDRNYYFDSLMLISDCMDGINQLVVED